MTVRDATTICDGSVDESFSLPNTLCPLQPDGKPLFSSFERTCETNVTYNALLIAAWLRQPLNIKGCLVSPEFSRKYHSLLFSLQKYMVKEGAIDRFVSKEYITLLWVYDNSYKRQKRVSNRFNLNKCDKLLIKGNIYKTQGFSAAQRPLLLTWSSLAASIQESAWLAAPLLYLPFSIRPACNNTSKPHWWRRKTWSITS